ncbi:MAG: KpsF/GutQ family sugar-phosphate isomerase [Pseudomonadaceae bacterium]|nr:KpsF/GutQ family sugar-phosphate isomerase [Pseudomonadaceae bacterium]
MTSAITTLRAEAAALETIAAALEAGDAGFAKAVKLVLATKGRVIVTGVGKSGHIGGKIAATLASTGTPSFFVHPTEALHGDLGMITEADVVLALSHSGESKELAAIVTYCTRFAIPLIALTGRPDSTLGRAATAILNNRVEKEACPLNLAPTTSTTASLALADALAVELMTARGFAKEDFARFHPGGKLGAQLLHVRELMIHGDGKLPLLPSTVSMREALVELTDKNLGIVGFVNGDGKLAGVFTDGDLKRQITHANLLDTPAAELMGTNPKTINADALAVQGVAAMQEHKVSSLWVLDAHQNPVGLFRLAECLSAGVV